MLDFYHQLSDWVVSFADSPWAVVALAINSFTESVFFPVPPDPLLIGVSISQPSIAIWLGMLVTVTSVAGAIVGHLLGRRYGRPLLQRMFSDDRIGYVERSFKRYGTWAILIAALTPVPYKVFAIAAGVLDLDMKTFVAASLVGRGLRFVTIGALVYMFGDTMEAFISDHFETLTIAGGGGLLALVAVFAIVRRWRTSSVLR